MNMRQLPWILPFLVILVTLVALLIIIIEEHDNNSTRIGGNNASSCPTEFVKYCLNEGKCVYLKEEEIVSCNCPEPYGGKRCEDYLCWYTWEWMWNTSTSNIPFWKLWNLNKSIWKFHKFIQKMKDSFSGTMFWRYAVLICHSVESTD